jgi:hypothetical protein
MHVCSQHWAYLITKDPDAYSTSLSFHGVSGETLTAGHDEDGVTIRTEFRNNKLSALGARELAAHLVECADRAEAWMATAAGMPLPVREHPARQSLLDIKERLENTTADLIDVISALSPEGHPPVCGSCGWSYRHGPACEDADPGPVAPSPWGHPEPSRADDPDEPTNRGIEPEPADWYDGPDAEDYDPGPEIDDQGGMSEYRYHEPEPWQ